MVREFEVRDRMQQRSLLTEQQATGDQGQECLTARMHRSESHVPQSPLTRHLSEAYRKHARARLEYGSQAVTRQCNLAHTRYLNAWGLANRSMCALEGEVGCPEVQRHSQ